MIDAPLLVEYAKLRMNYFGSSHYLPVNMLATLYYLLGGGEAYVAMVTTTLSTDLA